MRHAFYDDYSEGAHPEILKAIVDGNGGQQTGYGYDEPSLLAADRIRARFNTDGDVYFTSAATQANFIGLSSMLRSYQAVIAPTTAHIHVHEAGALEATGHKILTVATPDGKLTPALIKETVAPHTDEHLVMPKVISLTQSTELGSVYTLDELRAITDYAKSVDMYVFIDGARLAMGVATALSAMKPEDVAALGVDMFTVGGTKVGGMFGEATVIVNPELRKDYRYHLKQHGALLAKGRFLGLQFARFFDEDDLWLQLGKESNDNANRLAAGLHGLGVEFASEPQTNQLFVVLPNATIAKLKTEFGFYEWEPVSDDATLVRFVCSWATPHDAIDELVDAVKVALGE